MKTWKEIEDWYAAKYTLKERRYHVLYAGCFIMVCICILSNAGILDPKPAYEYNPYEVNIVNPQPSTAVPYNLYVRQYDREATDRWAGIDARSRQQEWEAVQRPSVHWVVEGYERGRQSREGGRGDGTISGTNSYTTTGW